MEYKELSARLKGLKVKQGLQKRVWKNLANHISDAEVIEAAGAGVDAATGGICACVVTGNTVYVGRPSNTFGGFDLSTLKREQVQSVDYSGTLLCTLTIGAPGGAVVVDKMGKPDAIRIAEALR